MGSDSLENEWIPDPPLAREIAATAIRSRFPQVDASDVHHLGSGGQYDVYLTSDGWAFRFPRWNWSGTLFDAEANVHRFVAEQLPSQIRVPRVELLAPPTPPFPRPFAGHRYIAGTALDVMDEELMPTIQREIAILLAALHSTPAPLVGAAGIHELEMDSGRREWLEHYSTVASQLRGIDPVVDGAIEWVGTQPTAPPPAGPLQLVHGDLGPEHVLANPATGFLTGVIDWTDTHLGDAARDFVFLVTWRGWTFAEEVLRLYSRAVDREFRTRLRFMSQLLSVVWLASAHEHGADLAKHIRAVHNAFSSHEASSPR